MKTQMTLRRFISALSSSVPLSVRVALRGSRSSPNWLATAIHGALNRVGGERYPILPCHGPLKGFRMRVDWEYHRSFAYGSWEPEVVRAIQQHVKAGMTVLDLGAQSGFFSLLLSKLVGPSGKVIAFEPLPANFRVLEENIRLNDVRNLTIRQEAVAERSGEMSFEFPKNEPTLIAGPLLEEDCQDTLTVKCTSLDEMYPGSSIPIRFIKMDVEGAEAEVLKGAFKLLDLWHPVMLIELHNMEGQGRRHRAVSILEERGYEIRWLSGLASTAHILVRWLPGTTLPDVTESPSAKHIADNPKTESHV